MSSGVTSMTRKRTHSLEQGGELAGSDMNAKKPRVSSEAPPNRRRRKGKKRALPVVDDIAGSSSVKSHDDGAEPMGRRVQRRGGHRGKPRQVIESDDEEDISVVPGSTPRSPMTQESQINVASTSSSPSLKGKEREVEPVPIKTITCAEDLSKKTEDLNEKLDAQTTKLALHSALVSSFKDSLTCQICVDLMYKPFTLAPCGHIACYSCLVGWFKSNAAEGEAGPQSVHRKKTCPHCRSAVRDRPVENFIIKEMVHSLVNSGVLQDVSEDARAVGAMPIAPADPWAGIFPKHREDNFVGLPVPDEDYGFDHGEGDVAVYDEADDVYRCRTCMNEVVGGVCTMCEREYQYTPEWGVGPLFGGLFGGHGDGLWGDDDSEEDEYSEEDYEGSFIDDDEGVGGGPRSGMDVTLLPFIDRDGEDDDDDEITEVGPPPAARQRNGQAPIVISSDEEDDDYPDADTHGEDEEDVDFHDARSDSDGRVETVFWVEDAPSDDAPYDYASYGDPPHDDSPYDYGEDPYDADDRGSDDDFYGYM